MLDRAAGVIVGQACGDALGAGYEFGPPLDETNAVELGGGLNTMGWDVGEWTDDTSMAIPLLDAAADGSRFDDAASLGAVIESWRVWARDARDVGIQIRAVLADVAHPDETSARAAAERLHRERGRSGGNGSLMRTGPVALAFLGGGAGGGLGSEPEVATLAALAAAARRVSELTHWEADAGDACALWSVAIRHAVLTGDLDVRVGLAVLPADRAARWGALLDEAEARHPRDFEQNGWVVHALQGAWSAISHGQGPVDALERAVRGGRDTDTVAAIAGQLLGAAHGASAFPDEWRARLHGWPDLRDADLVARAERAATASLARS
ncbi:ADP-ribosylglycohydrolase family protein [Schumannella sp. 10F1B-5-1]|nr:ADP-ribosylglycohydrolase family protein [Schumannella sp. 10F1B-5-1]